MHKQHLQPVSSDSTGVVWWKRWSRPCLVHLQRKVRTQVPLQDLIWGSHGHGHQEKCWNAGKQDTAVLSGSGCVLKDNRNGGRVNPNVNTAWWKQLYSSGRNIFRAFEQDKSENQECLVPHGLECWRHFENSNLYLMSKRVESSSSSFSSLRGAISTRSAGVVMMSYLRVFLILLPDLWEEQNKRTNL